MISLAPGDVEARAYWVGEAVKDTYWQKKAKQFPTMEAAEKAVETLLGNEPHCCAVTILGSNDLRRGKMMLLRGKTYKRASWIDLEKLAKIKREAAKDAARVADA